MISVTCCQDSSHVNIVSQRMDTRIDNPTTIEELSFAIYELEDLNLLVSR